MQYVLAPTKIYVISPIIFNSIIEFNNILYQLSDKTFSDGLLLQARQWLETCLSKHEICRAKPSSPWFFPTRLLHIEDSTKLRLALRHEVPAGQAYATLSHCWGSGAPITLTADNLGLLRSGFSVDILPQTYQDAILFACGMDLQYLWIDSLCIIQDSDSDWRIEASTMGQVYQNGLINIAATDATHAREGMFRSRCPLRIVPQVVGITRIRSCNLQYFHVVDEDLHRQISSAPLNKRGWVLQERLLSPRTFQFADDQVFWECCHGVACEAIPEFDDFRYHKDLGFDKRALRNISNEKIEDFESQLRETLSPRNSGAVHNFWEQCVEAYSRTSLTYQSDKLIALSGIASVIASKIQDHWVQGLWVGTLPQDLLWRSDNDTTGSMPLDIEASSLSWASVSSRISFFLNSRHRYLQDADVVDLDFSLLKAEEFEAQDRAVRLTGHLTSAELRPTLTPIPKTERSETEVLLCGTKMNMRIYPDIPVIGDSPLPARAIRYSAFNEQECNCVLQSVFLLPFRRDYSSISGLVLKPTGLRKGEFVRCGVFRFWTKDCDFSDEIRRLGWSALYERSPSHIEDRFYEEFDGQSKYTIRVI